ncbi:MAG: class C sortase [Lachnospiraceae bacterium]|nr:class C sortase [Lachnospiraceae bacterium]
MKRKLVNLFILLLFLGGLSIFLYPSVSNYVNEKNASRVISSYNHVIDQMAEEDYSKELSEAKAYNAYLAGFPNLMEAAFAEREREDSPYESLLNVGGNGILAAIRIPGIQVNLPIYHGTDESVLQVAAGHYLGSSLPVGGPGTHAILTGHRGLPSARLFTDLDRLEEGDIFYVKVLGEILEYQIDQIQVVLPQELDSLSIVEGEDYVTLVTCTPYGINSHRMLIRGTRVPYDGNYEEKVAMKPAPANSDVPKEEQGNGFTMKQWILFGAAALIAAILAGLLLPGKKAGEKQISEESGGSSSDSREREKREGSHEKNK